MSSWLVTTLASSFTQEDERVIKSRFKDYVTKDNKITFMDLKDKKQTNAKIVFLPPLAKVPQDLLNGTMYKMSLYFYPPRSVYILPKNPHLENPAPIYTFLTKKHSIEMRTIEKLEQKKLTCFKAEMNSDEDYSKLILLIQNNKIDKNVIQQIIPFEFANKEAFDMKKCILVRIRKPLESSQIEALKEEFPEDFHISSLNNFLNVDITQLKLFKVFWNKYKDNLDLKVVIPFYIYCNDESVKTQVLQVLGIQMKDLCIDESLSEKYLNYLNESTNSKTSRKISQSQPSTIPPKKQRTLYPRKASSSLPIARTNSDQNKKQIEEILINHHILKDCDLYKYIMFLYESKKIILDQIDNNNEEIFKKICTQINPNFENEYQNEVKLSESDNEISDKLWQFIKTEKINEICETEHIIGELKEFFQELAYSANVSIFSTLDNEEIFSKLCYHLISENSYDIIKLALDSIAKEQCDKIDKNDQLYEKKCNQIYQETCDQLYKEILESGSTSSALNSIDSI